MSSASEIWREGCSWYLSLWVRHDGFRRKGGSHEAPNSLRRYSDGVRDLAPSASAPNDRPRLSINLTLVHLVSRISLHPLACSGRQVHLPARSSVCWLPGSKTKRAHRGSLGRVLIKSRLMTRPDQCPLWCALRTQVRHRDMSEKCHVWTAPAMQEESDVSARRSGAAMYPAFECSAMAAGPDVIR
jgi:hypothetical protein